MAKESTFSLQFRHHALPWIFFVGLVPFTGMIIVGQFRPIPEWLFWIAICWVLALCGLFIWDGRRERVYVKSHDGRVCRSCYYSLRGIAPDERGGVTCPECGKCWTDELLTSDSP